MQVPDIPANEQERLRALKALCVLDTEPEEEFDQFARLAALICATPYAAVSLIDSERQWFKAFEGNSEVKQTHRSVSFCGHAIHSSAITEVPDALQDPRFHDNPLVTGFPNLRFYAGAPLRLSSGLLIGTLCARNGNNWSCWHSR